MPNGKPNILVLWGDDIGWWNVSAYNHGTMGYRTPNIDRIGREGAMFTVWYGQQSCTAGRAAFITGQSPIRTGLTVHGFDEFFGNLYLLNAEEEPEHPDYPKPEQLRSRGRRPRTEGRRCLSGATRPGEVERLTIVRPAAVTS